jgi:ATP-dependent Clp protease ATP-binding subunit ClpA
MFERFTDDARAVVRRAVDSANRLGHRQVGTEHLLLAIAAAEAPAGEVLREQGVTPELVKDQIVRKVGLGAGAGLFAGLDENALAAIGIDLDAVRATIEASFSEAALYRAAQSVYAQQRRRPRRWRPRLHRRKWNGIRPGSVDAKGRYIPPDRQHLPFTPRAKKVLELSYRESLTLKDTYIGVEHIALAVVGAGEGLAPSILSALHAHAALLRTAILNRYRQAS